jgi:hypothetical protein
MIKHTKVPSSVRLETSGTAATPATPFSATGSALSGASVISVLDVAGALQFDGQGNVTANWTQVSNLATSAIAATGTYSPASSWTRTSAACAAPGTTTAC